MHPPLLANSKDTALRAVHILVVDFPTIKFDVRLFQGKSHPQSHVDVKKGVRASVWETGNTRYRFRFVSDAFA